MPPFRKPSPEMPVAADAVEAAAAQWNWPPEPYDGAVAPASPAVSPTPLMLWGPKGRFINFCDACIASTLDPDAMEPVAIMSVARYLRDNRHKFEDQERPTQSVVVPDAPIPRRSGPVTVPGWEGFTDDVISSRLATLTTVLRGARIRGDRDGVRIVVTEIRAWRSKTPLPLPRLASF